MKLAFLMGLAWCESLLYASGVGTQMSVYEKFLLLTFLYSFILFFSESKKQFTKTSKALILIIPIALSFQYFGSEISGGYTWKYISVFTVTYIMSKQTVRAKDLLYTAFIYGTLGFTVLLIYNFGGMFSGWNPNHIAILSMFSYLFLACGLCLTNGGKTRIMSAIIISFLYLILLNKCSSRGSSLFCCVALICLLKRENMARLYEMTAFRNAVVIAPLVLAVGVVLFANSVNMDYWDSWSKNNWDKPLFNGRDVLWEIGFENVARNWLVGTGNLSLLNWHNSAITSLIAFGILGYALLCLIYLTILKKASKYSKDYICNMLVTTFVVIYLEQSVELGMVAEKVYFIPYASLGLILGRINTIQRLNSSNKMTSRQ